MHCRARPQSFIAAAPPAPRSPAVRALTSPGRPRATRLSPAPAQQQTRRRLHPRLQQARLLVGRRLSYRINKDSTSDNHNEEPYLTLVRTSPDHPDGRATMLLNWKLLAVEFSPEEDAVFVLLLCIAIAWTMTEIRREDVAGLLVRRRIREARVRQRDWGSVMLPNSLDPHLQPWYRNAVQVLSSAETVPNGVMPTKFSRADGKDELYRQALIP